MIKFCRETDDPAWEAKAPKFPVGELPVIAFLAGCSQSTGTVDIELVVDQQLGKILLPNLLGASLVVRPQLEGCVLPAGRA